MQKSLIQSLCMAIGSLVLFMPAQGSAMLTDASEGRVIEGLSEWQFCQDTSEEGSAIVLPRDADWTTLEIPHVFRLSGLPEKSAGFYRKTLTVAAEDSNKCFYIFFEGAGAILDVFVNGEHVGQHKGAYTAAAIDLTPALKSGEDNELVVRVTNRDKESANCLSQSNLFYTNGGLYRPVWLVKTLGVHIFPDTGSTGVYLTPGNISKKSADLEMTTHVRNSLKKPMQITVRNTISDPAGNEVARTEEKATIPSGTTRAITVKKKISNPMLWDIHESNLYTVRSEVLVNGQLADAVIERTGFRTIEIMNGDFMLNGKHLLVRGVCKHHMDEHVWNAMDGEQLKWEMDGMVDLGVNAVRLAHYPHRRVEYNMADEHGIVVWAENGLAGHRWDKGERAQRESEPTEVGEQITREMVRQNWNHPSIIFWSSGNETHEKTASHYADTIRGEDQTRLITYASAGEKPANVDFVAGNTYQGWYYSHYMDFQKLPENAYVSETGVGIWISHHIPYNQVETVRQVWDVNHFEPAEYGELFTEYRLQQIFRDNPDGHKMFLWWNYREFYDRKFKMNRNTKGILTLGGMPKDYYYLYQSFLRPDLPVLQLSGRHHFYRQFDPSNGIKAYSNAKSVELFVNGESQGVKKNGEYKQPDSLREKDGQNVVVEGININNVFFWNAPLAPGRNVVEVRDGRGNTKSMVIYQKADAMPVPADSLVVDLTSSNENNPAIFIDRPVEAQGPFYSEVDGSSDNTFDTLPQAIEGAHWITTKRLSVEENKTEIRFTVTKPSTVYVMYASGTFPAITLEQPDEGMMKTADALKTGLSLTDFNDTGITGIWRRHNLWLADFGLMSRTAKAGESITIPGQTLDYVVLVKPL